MPRFFSDTAQVYSWEIWRSAAARGAGCRAGSSIYTEALNPAKIAGLVGGIGPESTIAYYRSIISRYRSSNGASRYPAVLIDSIDVDRVLSLAQGGALDDLAAYLVQSIERLAFAGAAFAALAANTVHLVFETVQQQSPIPLISIVKVAADKAACLGATRVGIFGTRPTMEGTFYHDVFASRGVEVVAPSTEERTYIHDNYVSQLVRGLFERTTKDKLLMIAETMRSRDEVQAIILAGTELPLLLQCESHDALPFLDTMKIHVEAIVANLLALEGASPKVAAT